ncbi:polysaccharide deacetylase family protein [Marinibaculum pumilum]|uniref:Chitooligosaccharide deacetylase n=1 Tax=Marinibaculum pumilum TaxID=1766165 RepID=A0ABV7L267_9PROT
MTRLALKVDVDTERGTRLGVPALADLLEKRGVQASFLFSLGPDNTGRAIRRVFRRGFASKVARTSVVQTYGLRTLMNGVLLPGPHIARRHGATMRHVAAQGHPVGVHCWDHVRWQDRLHGMTADKVVAEWDKAAAAFAEVFGEAPRAAGSAGWQANALSLAVYDRAGLAYGSDSRGTAPFRPSAGGQVFRTVQIPTTLPTLDELIGRPEFPDSELQGAYRRLMRPDRLNVWTLHAELEGMRWRDWFAATIDALLADGVHFTTLEAEAESLNADPAAVPVAALEQGEVEGRSGTLAVQGAVAAAA